MLLKFYKLTLAPSALRALMHQRGHHKHTSTLLWHIHSFWSWKHMALSIIYILYILSFFKPHPHLVLSTNTKTANFVTTHFQKKCKQIICCNRLTLHFNLKYITRHLCFISFRCAPSGCFNCKNALNVGFTDIFHSV